MAKYDYSLICQSNTGVYKQMIALLVFDAIFMTFKSLNIYLQLLLLVIITIKFFQQNYPILYFRPTGITNMLKQEIAFSIYSQQHNQQCGQLVIRGTDSINCQCLITYLQNCGQVSVQLCPVTDIKNQHISTKDQLQLQSCFCLLNVWIRFTGFASTLPVF